MDGMTSAGTDECAGPRSALFFVETCKARVSVRGGFIPICGAKRLMSSASRCRTRTNSQRG